jgi:hypothetical protein
LIPKELLSSFPRFLTSFPYVLFSSILGLRTRASLCWLSGACFGGPPLPRNSRPSRESGNPMCSGPKMDPRSPAFAEDKFHGGDDEGGFHSLGWAASP